MEKLDLATAENILAHVDRGGASRLGIIEMNGGDIVGELRSINQARDVVARQAVPPKEKNP